MEAINMARQNVWNLKPDGFLVKAVIDVDGSLAPTPGQGRRCDISHTHNCPRIVHRHGLWLLHPLFVIAAELETACFPIFRTSSPSAKKPEPDAERQGP
jgi:hypothetical protein